MKVAYCILLTALLTSCSRSGVEVENHTSSVITSINIRVAGNELGIDRIDPGDSRRVGYSTRNEETISVDFQIRGEKKNCAKAIYVSPPFEDEFKVDILQDGECSITVKSDE